MLSLFICVALSFIGLALACLARISLCLVCDTESGQRKVKLIMAGWSFATEPHFLFTFPSCATHRQSSPAILNFSAIADSDNTLLSINQINSLGKRKISILTGSPNLAFRTPF